MPLQTTFEFAVHLSKQAGGVLLQHFRQPLIQESKSDVVDIVTQADKASEMLIVEALSAQFPHHHIVGEEGGGQGAPAEDAEYFWYVDPLDGTVNFANGLPHFCVSIALANKQRDPLLGVVYDPNRDETFTAIAGEGAFLNGQPIHVSQTDELVRSVLASGFAYDRRTNPDNNLRQWGVFMPQVRGLRRMGSAALDFCYVASGRLDGYWERSLKSWDAMAGMLIAREAGATVTDYEGGDTPQLGADGRFITANPRLHAVMLALIQESYTVA